MNPRLQVMLESRQIEAAAAEDGEVQGMWMKSIRSLHSSRVEGLDADSAFTLEYQARCRPQRRSCARPDSRCAGDGHHHHTVAAVAALGLGEISDAARDLNVIRQRRHGAIYDWESVQEKDLSSIGSAAARLVLHGRAWLGEQRPMLNLPESG